MPAKLCPHYISVVLCNDNYNHTTITSVPAIKPVQTFEHMPRKMC